MSVLHILKNSIYFAVTPTDSFVVIGIQAGEKVFELYSVGDLHLHVFQVNKSEISTLWMLATEQVAKQCSFLLRNSFSYHFSFFVIVRPIIQWIVFSLCMEQMFGMD